MIDQKSILVTGGSGLLGNELRRILPDADYPSRSDFDVTKFEQMDGFVKNKHFATIFHAAAFTSPPKVDQNPEEAIESNIVGTSNVTRLCIKYGMRLIYISTDYVFRGDRGNYAESDAVFPVNKYAWSKLGGECAVRMYDNAVIVRTSFGPAEFPYEKAFVDQWTSRETVSTIAEMMLKIIDSDFRGVIHVGGERKTVYDYALKTSPGREIGRLSRDEVSFKVPADTSLEVGLFNEKFHK